MDHESELIERLGIRCAGPKELINESDLVLEWISDNNIKHLAIHLDLDALDPKLFRSLLFAKPEPLSVGDWAEGEMTFSQVARLIKDVSAQTNVVGLGITEHTPWDAINFKNFLAQLPILAQK